MQWDKDPYKELKWQIFDILKSELKEDDAVRISMKQLMDGINRMIDELIMNEEQL